MPSRKKNRLAVHMMEDNILNTFYGIFLTIDRYEHKDMCNIIDGVAIEEVKGS